jgi:hypothetical protein
MPEIAEAQALLAALGRTYAVSAGERMGGMHCKIIRSAAEQPTSADGAPL